MSADSPLVSVLVPIYGVEKYIERCARSIFEQTYQNLEIIFVNDCTPDNSMFVLDRVMEDYPDRKTQTRIINHENNKGLAAARKTALLASHGYYIQNYDSDDYVDADMIQQMVALAQREEADITICDYKQVYESDSYYDYIKVSPSLKTEKCLLQILSGRVHSGVWNKLIKRSLYVENEIFPIEGLNMCEDLAVMYRLVYYAKKITYIPKAFYNYVIGRSGAYTSTKMSLAQQKNIMDLICHFETFFKDKKVDEAVYKEIKYFKVGTLCKITLYGDLDYYKQTKSIFEDIRLYDILYQPTIGWRLKICGICLYLRQMYLVNMLRALRKNIKH